MSRYKKTTGLHVVHMFARTSVLVALGVIVLLIIVSTTYYSRQPGWPTIQIHHETTAQRMAPIGAIYAGDAGRAALKKAEAAANSETSGNQG